MKKKIAILAAAVMTVGACVAFTACDDTSGITADTDPDTIVSDKVSEDSWKELCSALENVQGSGWENGNYSVKGTMDYECVNIDIGGSASTFLSMYQTWDSKIADNKFHVLSAVANDANSPASLEQEAFLVPADQDDGVDYYLRMCVNSEDGKGEWGKWSAHMYSQSYAETLISGWNNMPPFDFDGSYNYFVYDEAAKGYCPTEEGLAVVSAAFDSWLEDMFRVVMEEMGSIGIGMSLDMDTDLERLLIKIQDDSVCYVEYEGTMAIDAAVVSVGGYTSRVSYSMDMLCNAMYYDWGKTTVKLPADLPESTPAPSV